MASDRNLMRAAVEAVSAFDAFSMVGVGEDTWGEKWCTLDEKMDALRAALMKPDPGVTVAADRRNERVAERYDELMREGRHGHYETLFRVVREEVERAIEPRPIETAPKDGTRILCYCPPSRLYKSGGWHDAAWSHYAYAFSANGQHGFASAPTHWLPLPENPK